jgi:hypothetical protein
LRMQWKNMFTILFLASLLFITHLMSLRLIIILSWPNDILTSDLQSSPLCFLAMSFHFGMTLHRNQIPTIRRKNCSKSTVRYLVPKENIVWTINFEKLRSPRS